MARPKRDDHDARSAHVAARFTAAERLDLDRRALAAGLTVSEFIRAASLDIEPRRATMPAGPAGVMSPAELKAFNALGNNLNQAVRLLHIGESERAALLHHLAKLETVWDRYLP